MLTAAKARKAAPRATTYKLYDRDGLALIVPPSGRKWWRLDYRYRGKRQSLSLGRFRNVSLAEARDKVYTLRKQLDGGHNPSVERKAERRRLEHAERHTFAAVAREWLAKQTRLAPSTVAKNDWLFGRYLFPALGRRAIASIEPPDVLDVLLAIERRGRHETAHRTKSLAGQVFRYGIATARVQRDPTADLRGALSPVVVTHFAAVLEPEAIGALLRAIEGSSGSFVVRQALRLAPYLFVRPGELRQAEWVEIDADAALWRIPETKTKARRPHLVPLARQALAILEEVRALTGRGRFVFPSIRTTTRPMSDNTLNATLRRLGYATDEMTAHGFRSMASTRLNEMGWRADVIERQLAHVEPNTVRAAYNHAEYLADRRTMMQAWADELDRLREDRPAETGAVVSFRR